MATQNIARMIDDLDGTEATVTVKFGLDDRVFMIDLNDENETRLRDFLAVYVDAATEVVPQATARPVSKGNGEAPKIREWAKSQGLAVGDRGRIEQTIVDAYRAAQTA